MSEKHIWFKLSKKSISKLYVYYGILIISSLLITFFFLLNFNRKDKFIELSIFSTALIASMGMSLLGCAISYIRKLYKSCINLDVSIPISQEDGIRQTGVLAYFILRPLFSLVFGLLLIVIFKAGISSVTKCDELSEKFVYVSVFFAFFTGYSIGDLIDLFEGKGKKIINKVFNNPEL